MPKNAIRLMLLVTMVVLSFNLLFSLNPKFAQAATPDPKSLTTPTETPAPTPTRPPTAEFGNNTVGKEMSSLVDPKTYTLCNYTTPRDMGNISQISIYLVGVPEGSTVRAVIFENEPDAKFPKGGEPVAQTTEPIKVKSIKGQWYNFTINYQARQNTTYWLGYYSEECTRYYFDENTLHLTVTSEQKIDEQQWIPVSWHFKEKTTLSLYAIYTTADPKPDPTPTNAESDPDYSLANDEDLTQGINDYAFVSVVMFAELGVIMIGRKNRNENY